VFLGYLVFLRYFVRACASGEDQFGIALARDGARGRQLYNILTSSSRAARDEDAYVREVIDEHQGAIGAHMRLISQFSSRFADERGAPHRHRGDRHLAVGEGS